jgi:hypothetical protein
MRAFTSDDRGSKTIATFQIKLICGKLFLFYTEGERAKCGKLQPSKVVVDFAGTDLHLEFIRKG